MKAVLARMSYPILPRYVSVWANVSFRALPPGPPSYFLSCLLELECDGSVGEAIWRSSTNENDMLRCNVLYAEEGVDMDSPVLYLQPNGIEFLLECTLDASLDSWECYEMHSKEMQTLRAPLVGVAGSYSKQAAEDLQAEFHSFALNNNYTFSNGTTKILTLEKRHSYSTKSLIYK